MKARGFTLIEVLVATAIAALMMLALMRAFSLGLTMVGRARDSLSAVLIAESTLDSLGRSIPLRTGRGADRVDGYRRTILIRPVASGGAAPSVAGLTAYRVSVAVSWRRDRHWRRVRLDSVRLGPRP